MADPTIKRGPSNEIPMIGYDPTGHQLVPLQVVSVVQDSATGQYYGVLNVNASFSASSLAINDGSNSSNKLAVDSNGKIGISSMPSVTATNPSVGTNGSAIPTSSTEMGASDGTNLQPLQVESSSNKNLRTAIYNGANEASVSAGGALKVDGSGATQPVSGTVTANIGTSGSLALETGGNLATLAGAVSSAKVQANTAQINGVAPSMGNGASGTGVQRVTIASDSTGQVALAAGAATIGSLAANQSVNINQWAGASPSNSNPVYASLALGSAVAAYGSNPSQTAAAAADTSFKWGVSGTTTVNHISIMNNTAASIYYAFDQSSVTSGNAIYVLTAGQIAFWDRSVTTLHVSSAAQQNFGGQSGITIEGFA